MAYIYLLGGYVQRHDHAGPYKEQQETMLLLRQHATNEGTLLPPADKLFQRSYDTWRRV